MKRFFLLVQVFLVFAIFVAITGINGCPQVQKEEKFGGLSVKFVENAPPLNVIVNQKFPIYVDINNIGDANVDKDAVKIYLSGIGKNIEGVKSSLSNKNFLDKGASERLVFADSAKSSLELSNPFTLAMFLTSCYKYGGKAQAEICIASSNASRICSISAATITSNSEEPVQITSLTEEINGNKLLLSFTIVNEGKGEVYLPDADCDKLQARDINEALKNGKVKISVRTLESFKCRLQALEAPYNTLDGLEGASTLGKVTCEKSLAGEEDHKAPLQIVLDYKYVESASQGIVIIPS